MKKQRIGIITDSFPTISETWIVNKIAHLLSLGYDIRILSFHKGDTNLMHPFISQFNLIERTSYFEFVPHTRWNRIKLIITILFKHLFEINWLVLIRCFNLFKNPRTSLDFSNVFLAQWFLVGKYDIIHAHYGHNGAYIANLLEKGIIKNIKLFTSFHGYDMWPNKINDFKVKYHNLINGNSNIIANSPYSKQLLLNIGFKENCIKIIPVGIDMSFFKNKKDITLRDNETFKIVFCGRLVEVKAPTQAIEVLNNIVNMKKYRNVSLHIIGNGDLYQDILKNINEFKLENHVVIHGALGYDQVNRVMENCSVLILPGIYEKETGIAETQGLVVQEAQALGLPVIVSDAGGAKFGVINGETGFVVEMNNIEEYANKIIYLMKNKLIQEKMSENAIFFVKENYDIKVIGKKLIDIYNK
jgi:colanic acid/amylovoran biosynthesis glycosyltransferase